MEKKDFSTERQNFLGGIVVGNRIEPIKQQGGQAVKQPMVQSEQQYKQQLEKMQKEEVSSIISERKYTLETNRKVNEYVRNARKKIHDGTFAQSEISLLRKAILRKSGVNDSKEDIDFFIQFCLRAGSISQAITLVNELGNQTTTINSSRRKQLLQDLNMAQKISKVKEYVQYLGKDYYGGRLSTNDIAKMVGMSEVEVIRIYKEIQEGIDPLAQLKARLRVKQIQKTEER